MLQKKNEGILFSAEIRVVGSYTDRLLSSEKEGSVAEWLGGRTINPEAPNSSPAHGLICSR